MPAVITNEFLQASVDADGIVNITDLRNGRILRDCLRLEDMADAGDSYKFIPGGDMPLYSDDWEKEVSMGECTGLKQTVRILYTMKLPEAYCFEEQARTRKTAVSSLALELTLRKGCPFVEINYTLDNASKDHRLRLCVDTDIAPAESWADSAFDVVRRTNENHYPGTYAKVEPNASFAALQQEGKGVAVFTVGAHAYEHPEKHRDLIVRVGGYSEYFIRLTPEMRKTVLERNLHEM